MSLQSAFLSLFSPPFPASKEAAAASWAAKLQPHMGGSGGGWSLANRPSTPHPADEEFEGDLSGWTVSGTADLVNQIDPYAAFASGGIRVDVNNRRPSWLLLQADGSTGWSPAITKPVVLAPDVFVWTRMATFRRGPATSNDSSLCLLLATAADPAGLEDSIRIYLLEADSTTPNIQIDRVVAGTATVLHQTINLGTNWNEIEFLGIHKRGTTYDFWIAPPSGQWRWIVQTSHPLTFDRVTVVAMNTVTTPPGNAIVGVDFIRFLELGGPP